MRSESNRYRPDHLLVLSAIAVLVATGGCAGPTRVADPLTGGPLAGNGASEKTAFWYQLARRPVVSNDEALHGLLLYFADDDPSADYAGRVNELKRRGMLSTAFDRPGDEAVERGTVAYAIAQGAGIKGGLTMQLLGSSTRYADRALQYRGLLPAGSPNQMLTGGQFASVIGRLEDFQRGNANEKRAALLPGEIGAVSADLFDVRDAARHDDSPGDVGRPLMLNVLALSANAWWQDTQPAAGLPATQPTKDNPAKLKAIITGVEGDLAEIRKSAADSWVKARVGQSLNEGGEFRTGPKSAIRFVIPPDQVFTVDRQCACTVQQAVFDGKKSTTVVSMDRGRVRMDVAPIVTSTPAPVDPATPKYRFDQAGFEHDVSIRSPNAALAVRGTLVSLYDEPGFAPEAVSLTGQAAFENTRRQVVAFGGTTGRTVIRGDQTGAAQQSLALATQLPNAQIARNDFDSQQTTMLLQRGGTQRGDVLVGNSRVTDAALVPTLPGVLSFVLRWDGGSERKLNDLNLAVFSPLHSAESSDFVANPPFTLSLIPGDPDAEAKRAQFYPRTSRSGGQISKNHVGPEGLEFASWTKKYPVGDYRVVVFNLLDAVPAPETTENPVSYTLDVFLNKQILINTVTGSVGELQTSTPVVVPVPATTGNGATAVNTKASGRKISASPPQGGVGAPPSLQARRERTR